MNPAGLRARPFLQDNPMRKFTTILSFGLSSLFVLFVAWGTAQAAEPVTAASFTLKSLKGESVSLDHYRGKYVLLNFWATWCGPCKVEMPSLEALYQRFKSDNFDVVAVSNDMFGEKVVRPYIEASKLSFTVLLDQQLKVSHQYGVVTLPTTFLIDPEGNIIGALYGAEDWTRPNTLSYFEDLLTKS